MKNMEQIDKVLSTICFCYIKCFIKCSRGNNNNKEGNVFNDALNTF